MKLTLEYHDLKDIQFSDKTCFKDRVVYVSKADLDEIAATETLFTGVNFSIARPGENSRVVHVVDCVEPRCKVEEGLTDWPGVLADEFSTAGIGTTKVLRGMSVMIVDNNANWNTFIAYLDMSGPGAELTPYSKIFNLVVEPTFEGEIDNGDFAEALHRLAFKISVFLAKLTLGLEPDEVEVFDNETRYPGLPNIAYSLQAYSTQYDCNSYREPMFYGYPIPNTLPLIVQPTEIIDGGLASAGGYRLMETYSIQNHAIIYELMRRHGKDLNFVGVVVNVVSLDAKRRNLSSMMIGNIMEQVLEADGVILTKNMGGAGNVDLANAASACEDRGIKTTLILQILNAESNLASEILFTDRRLNAIVQNGVYFDRVNLPPAKIIHGGNEKTRVLSDKFEQYAPDALELQSFRVFGRINHTGSSMEQAVEY